MARDTVGMERRSKIHVAALLFVIDTTVTVTVFVTLYSFFHSFASHFSVRCIFVSLVDSRSLTQNEFQRQFNNVNQP